MAKKRKWVLVPGETIRQNAITTITDDCEFSRVYEVRTGVWRNTEDDSESSEVVLISQQSRASSRKPSCYVMAIEPEAIEAIISSLKEYLQWLEDVIAVGGDPQSDAYSFKEWRSKCNT